MRVLSYVRESHVTSSTRTKKLPWSRPQTLMMCNGTTCISSLKRGSLGRHWAISSYLLFLFFLLYLLLILETSKLSIVVRLIIIELYFKCSLLLFLHLWLLVILYFKSRRSMWLIFLNWVQERKIIYRCQNLYL